ncbi:hypothetical protein OFDDKENP_00029 [Aeromonas phage B614]|nr:hypothetical protein OFDDKENP_00029 [Aeromonas phage B614]UYD58228.1 hypothetical protein JNEOFJEA_00149 [Aeromonas phage UP87]UYD58592.1 hypothetical protein IPAKJDPM_00266 [Aeromonas phage avDM14-QBC]UYD58806.1 hypothetical protein HNNIDBEH_00230 [Aeromonas phage avDM10-HWA]UYD58891.1 hypothetical protein OFOPOMKI_00024 [Aeromonas phage avDM7-IJDJ]UYD59951.1 hypothetical protein LEHPIFIF_00178 [Aeromonas phage avDM9-HANS]
MQFLLDLFVASVQYSIVALIVYILLHGYAFFDEWRQGRPDSKFPAKSLSAVQIYGTIAAAWLPVALFLLWKLVEFIYIKVAIKIHE